MQSIWGTIVVIIVFVSTAAPVVANSGGIANVSGRSGSFCTFCHVGGQVPDVAFEAPEGTRMLTGAIATFRFRITSARRRQQTHAGFDVAPSAGTLGIIDSTGTRLALEGRPDVTHTMPRLNDSEGVAVFEFTWQAPKVPGIYTLYGAGNSVNFDGTLGGDNASATTLDITVVAAATETATITPSATPSPPPTLTEPPTLTPTPEVTSTATTDIGNPCTGDCDGSVDVTVDEVVRGVNIGLGTRPVADCRAFDRDGDGLVTVDEIVAAIGNALNGCV